MLKNLHEFTECRSIYQDTTLGGSKSGLYKYPVDSMTSVNPGTIINLSGSTAFPRCLCVELRSQEYSDELTELVKTPLLPLALPVLDRTEIENM